MAGEQSTLKSEQLSPLSKAAQAVVIGGTYEHYKKKRYKVLAVARHSESLEEFVVYQALYGESAVWVRPVAMFLESILIDGCSYPRFRLLSQDLREVY